MTRDFPLGLQKAAIAASIILALWFFGVGLHQKSSNGVETFYYAAKAAQAGEDIYASHSPKLDPQYVYPPLFAVAMTPLLQFQLMPATRLWLCFNVLVTGLALWIGAREIGRRLQLPTGWRFTCAYACAAFVLSAGEIKTEWGTGQTDTLTLLAFTLALAWLDKRPILAGLALGAAANIKYQPLFAVPYLLVRGRWRAALSGILSTVAVALLPALVLGWQRNLQFLGEAFGGLGKFAGLHTLQAAKTVKLTWIRSVSITSALGRLLEHIGHDPGKAFLIAGLVALLFLGVIWGIYRARGFNLLTGGGDPATRSLISAPASLVSAVTSYEWSGLMVAWLAFGPEVSRRHMFVLLLLNLVAVGILIAAARHGINRRPLLVGLVVFQIGLRLPPAKWHAPSEFWNGIGGPSECLLFYYATLLWTGLAVARALAEKSHEPTKTPSLPG